MPHRRHAGHQCDGPIYYSSAAEPPALSCTTHISALARTARVRGQAPASTGKSGLPQLVENAVRPRRFLTPLPTTCGLHLEESGYGLGAARADLMEPGTTADGQNPA